MQNPKLVHILLRISIASVFLYAAIGATLQPQNWLVYIPLQLQTLVPGPLFLTAFSLFQLLLSIWLLSGWKSFYAALIAALTFLGIISANFTALDILFRDFALFFVAIALVVASYGKKKQI